MRPAVPNSSWVSVRGPQILPISPGALHLPRYALSSADQRDPCRTAPRIIRKQSEGGQTGARGPGTGIPKPSHVSRLPGPAREHPAGAVSMFPGGERGSDRVRRAAGAAVNSSRRRCLRPRRESRAVASSQRGNAPGCFRLAAPSKTGSFFPLALREAIGEAVRSPGLASPVQRLRCKSCVLTAPGAGNVTKLGREREGGEDAPGVSLLITRRLKLLAPGNPFWCR